MNIKVVLGVCSLIVAIIGYIPYIRNVLRRKTKPHVYTWLVWSVLAVIGFGIQVQGKGGPGTWLLGLTVLATVLIFVLSLRMGHKNVTFADKMSLFFSGLAFILWIVTNQPVMAAILITIIEATGGFFPTFRKSYTKPYEETALSYFTYATSVCFSLLALEKYSPENVIYPAGVFFMNISLVIFLLVRRSQLKRL